MNKLQEKVDTYNQLGCVSFDGVIPEEILADVEKTIATMVQLAVDRLDTEKRSRFDALFRPGMSLVHEGLLFLHQIDTRSAQLVIDAAGSSQSLYALFAQKDVIDLVCAVVGVDSQSKLGAIQHYMRADYPSTDPAHTKKISLPYHQESAYFKANVSLDTGTVAWVPLFDCAPKHGSIRVRPGSHKLGFVKHDEYYLDEVNKRHLRTRLPPAKVDEFAEEALNVPRGGIAFQHFHLFHASGKNVVDYHVRYTMLARYSDMTASDYRPASWA